MILILKLLTGAEIIGTVEDAETPIHQLDIVTVYDPMTVVDYKDEYGHSTMRLNDTLLLSGDDNLTFSMKHVITYYRPAEKVSEYYEKAMLYAKQQLKPRLHSQISKSIKDIDDMISELSDDDPWTKFMRAANNKPTEH